MKTFVESQFNYCNLIWMLHFRTSNNKINRLHERALRMFTLIINHHLIPFWKRMALFQSIIEIFKVQLLKYINIVTASLQLLRATLQLNQPPTYNLRTCQELYSRNPKTVGYGTEIMSFLAPKIWAIVPQNIKNCTSLSSFKINIRKWKPDCPCRLCKCFLKHAGFI